MVCSVNGQVKGGKMFLTRFHRFHKHLLRTQRHHLIIIFYIILAIEYDSHFLF